MAAPAITVRREMERIVKVSFPLLFFVIIIAEYKLYQAFKRVCKDRKFFRLRRITNEGKSLASGMKKRLSELSKYGVKEKDLTASGKANRLGF